MRRARQRSPICSTTLRCFTTVVANTPPSATFRRRDSLQFGSAVSMSKQWQHERAPLADEKQREAQVDPSRGSNNMALGTQQVPIRAGIPVHQHNEADEVLFVLEGAGFGILGDTRMRVEKGSAMYVPNGVWHGIENPDSELLLLWAV